MLENRNEYCSSLNPSTLVSITPVFLCEYVYICFVANGRIFFLNLKIVHHFYNMLGCIDNKKETLYYLCPCSGYQIWVKYVFKAFFNYCPVYCLYIILYAYYSCQNLLLLKRFMFMSMVIIMRSDYYLSNFWQKFSFYLTQS